MLRHGEAQKFKALYSFVAGTFSFVCLKESQTRFPPVPFGTLACRGWSVGFVAVYDGITNSVPCPVRHPRLSCGGVFGSCPTFPLHNALGRAWRLPWYNSTWGGPYESQTKMLLSRSAPAACCRVVCSVRGPLIFWHKPSGQVRDSCGMRRCQRPQPPGDALFRITNDAVLFRPTAFSSLLGGVFGSCPFLPPASAGCTGSVTPAEARSLQ